LRRWFLAKGPFRRKSRVHPHLPRPPAALPMSHERQPTGRDDLSAPGHGAARCMRGVRRADGSPVHAGRCPRRLPRMSAVRDAVGGARGGRRPSPPRSHGRGELTTGRSRRCLEGIRALRGGGACRPCPSTLRRPEALPSSP
jgi:hypothetical protein